MGEREGDSVGLADGDALGAALGLALGSSVHTTPQPQPWSTCPAQSHLSAAMPEPPQTLHSSTTLPEFGTPSQPAQLDPSPPHTLQASSTSCELHVLSQPESTALPPLVINKG